jgi:hypothetical protein
VEVGGGFFSSTEGEFGSSLYHLRNTRRLRSTFTVIYRCRANSFVARLASSDVERQMRLLIEEVKPRLRPRAV